MKIKYCLPIVKRSKEDILEMIQKHRSEYQYFEIWMDYIEEIDNIFVNTIVHMLGNKLILLFQRGNTKKEGLPDEKKLQILDTINKTDVYLDLDLSETKELAYLKENNIKVNTIISYHNYQQTPVDLAEILKQMDAFHPTIYKIATMCTSETDALKLLLVQQNLKMQNKRHIILGMGAFGTITRVFGTLWGNELIYAPQTQKEASAPGQLTKHELETIFAMLKTKH